MKELWIDVTDQVVFLGNDGELLPIIKCVCGKEFPPWNFAISIYEDNPNDCPNCGRKLFFRNRISVYSFIEKETKT